jgi:signal transduction histidine kinase
VLVHLIYQHTSVYAVNLLVMTYNVISIYFFYHVLDYLEVGVEYAVIQATGSRSKNRSLRFMLEFVKLFFAIFITNLLQFYLVGRPIFNQNYDPNFLFIVLAFSIPSAAIARIIFELRQAQELALQSRLAQAEAQYNLLEAQMQPHFLFNSLNVLSELIYVDPDLACSVTQQLADLYREILTNSKQNFSNLGSEISILKKYIQIQKIRFGDRIRFKCDIDPSLDDLSVPSLILQTLVENAIKHGISPRQQGGDIELTVTPVEGSMYEITVSNTGELYKGPKTKELGTGLQNTKNRLELFYGRSHGFNIYSDQNKTYVKFRVPQHRELQEKTV